MVKIFIVENIPSLNKGEMAILDGMLESFRPLGAVEVSMLSPRPEIDTLRYGPKIRLIDINKSWPYKVGLNSGLAGRIVVSILVMLQHIAFMLSYKIFGVTVLSLFRSEIWKEYVETDVIIEGHDSSFGIGSGPGMPYFYLLYLPFFCKALGKPIVLYGGTIGQVKQFHWLAGKMFKSVLSRIDLISFRERVSYQYTEAIGFHNERVYVTADPAFLLQPVPAEKVKEIMRQEGIEKSLKPLIGITVTREIASRAFPQSDTPSSSYHKHIEILVELTDTLTDILNATVIFIPHCVGFGEELDDRLVAKDIFEECQNKERVKVITNEYSAAELKGLIGQFDFFIGERVHSVINAMSMEVPSIVISFRADQRIDIIRMLGQDDAVCYVENLDAQALFAKINDIWSKRDKIKDELKSQAEIMKERAMLNGALLRKLLYSQTKDI